MRAICNYRNGNIENCLTDLTKILNSGESIILLELNPILQKVQIVDLSQVLKLRAKCEKHLKNFSAALEDLEKAIYQNPDAATHRSRAEVLYKLGLAERALTDLDIAEEKLPADTNSQQLRMLCLTRIGRKDEAAKIAKSILEKEPGNTIATQTLRVLDNVVSIPIIGRAQPASNVSVDSYLGQ
jgi:tetratricopeptide (TPR) repeat protein